MGKTKMHPVHHAVNYVHILNLDVLPLIFTVLLKEV